MICLHHNIWRSSHRVLFTSGSLFPEGSAGAETEKPQTEWMRRASKANLQETEQGHVESVTVSPSLASPTGTCSSSQGRPCIYPTCRLNQTHWIESGERGKCLHKAGERKALRQGVAGANNGWARGAEPLVRRRQPQRWSDTMLWPRPRLPGGESRADKEIAREEKGKILPWLWRQVLLWNCLYLFSGSTTLSTLRSGVGIQPFARTLLHNHWVVSREKLVYFKQAKMGGFGDFCGRKSF